MKSRTPTLLRCRIQWLNTLINTQAALPRARWSLRFLNIVPDLAPSNGSAPSPSHTPGPCHHRTASASQHPRRGRVPGVGDRVEKTECTHDFMSHDRWMNGWAVYWMTCTAYKSVIYKNSSMAWVPFQMLPNMCRVARVSLWRTRIFMKYRRKPNYKLSLV
jgi:hypothetical protein